MGNKLKEQINRSLILNKWAILIVLGIIMFFGVIGFIARACWYVYQCNSIYNQVTGCTGDNDITIYGEYDGQTVKVAYGNRTSIWDTVTEKMVTFTSADKMPAQQPVILRFEDKLKMEIYPAEGKDLFVKHITDKETKYYIIKNACDFSYLKKMVSIEGWNVPNMIAK